MVISCVCTLIEKLGQWLHTGSRAELSTKRKTFKIQVCEGSVGRVGCNHLHWALAFAHHTEIK